MLVEQLSIFSMFCAAAGVLIFLAPVTARISFSEAWPIALDFWTAAGLIRLSAIGSWNAIAVAGLVIGIRKMTGAALQRTLRTGSGGRRDFRHQGSSI